MRVILDADLARIYNVNTSALNQAIHRNKSRFPADFMFQLTKAEFENLKSQIVTSSSWGGRRKLPFAFTEHGAVMVANLLRSPRAIGMSIEVVRAFINLRHLAVTHRELAARINELENKYDKQFQVVFDALRELFDDDEQQSKKKPVGYHTELEGAK